MDETSEQQEVVVLATFCRRARKSRPARIATEARHVLALVTEGSVKLKVESRSRPIAAGTLLFIPGGTSVLIVGADERACLWELHFTLPRRAFIELDGLRRDRGALHTALTFEQRLFIEETFLKLVRERARVRPATAMAQSALAGLALVSANRWFQARGHRSRRVLQPAKRSMAFSARGIVSRPAIHLSRPIYLPRR